MPYARSYRRRSYRKRRPRKPKYTTMGSAYHLAKKAAQGVWYLKGLVNSEILKHDVSGSGSITDSGTVIPLTSIAQGDTLGARTGNSLFMRMMDLRLNITRDPTTGNAVQLVRVSVVIDKQQISDTTPSITNIYDTAAPTGHLNSSFSGRFAVIWTRTFQLDNTDDIGRYFRIFKKMRHHVRYNGTLSSDIQKGGMYLTISSDQSASGYPVYLLDGRMSYHDN